GAKDLHVDRPFANAADAERRGDDRATIRRSIGRCRNQVRAPSGLNGGPDAHALHVEADAANAQSGHRVRRVVLAEVAEVELSPPPRWLERDLIDALTRFAAFGREEQVEADAVS